MGVVGSGVDVDDSSLEQTKKIVFLVVFRSELSALRLLRNE